jgi:hypothetical protein
VVTSLVPTVELDGTHLGPAWDGVPDVQVHIEFRRHPRLVGLARVFRRDKRRSSSLSVVESVGESDTLWAAAGMARESKTRAAKKPHASARGMRLLLGRIEDHG